MDESGCTGLPHLLHLPAEICWVFTEKSSQLLLCLVVAHCPGSQEQCLRGLMQWTTYALFRLAEYTALLLAPSPCKRACCTLILDPWVHVHVMFSSIFSRLFRCMCTVVSCGHCKFIAPVTRKHVWAHGWFSVRLVVFKVLRNGLLRYILYTCPNLWCNSCSKCYGMDCFGTHWTDVQTCDVTRVHSATEWIASVHTLHMSKPVM